MSEDDEQRDDRREAELAMLRQLFQQVMSFLARLMNAFEERIHDLGVENTFLRMERDGLLAERRVLGETNTELRAENESLRALLGQHGQRDVGKKQPPS